MLCLRRSRPISTNHDWPQKFRENRMCSFQDIISVGKHSADHIHTGRQTVRKSHQLFSVI